MKKNNLVQMSIFSFVKKVFVLGLLVLLNFTNALDCVLMKNQECKVGPEIVNINSNNPIFSPFSIKINKCSGNCNNMIHMQEILILTILDTLQLKKLVMAMILIV